MVVNIGFTGPKPGGLEVEVFQTQSQRFKFILIPDPCEHVEKHQGKCFHPGQSLSSQHFAHLAFIVPFSRSIAPADCG